MRKDRIIEILNKWNFWGGEQEAGIIREEYLKNLENLERTKQIVSIVGARRSGKSTLMMQYIRHLIETGVDKRNTLYVNLEEPRFFGELSLQLLQDIYEAYLEYIEPKIKPYIFLDEIQNIQGWEKFVRALHERKEATIFVSGSSSKLLSAEFGTVLTGRHVRLEVFPLSFKEFLKFNNLDVKEPLDIISNKIKIKGLLRGYAEFGGFPQVVLSEEKNELLTRYFEDVLSRDVIERYKIRKIDKLKALAKYYLTNVASPISFRRIKKFIDLPLDTVERFSYFLAYSNLIFFVRKFSYSLKEQEVNPRKVYCVDTGLRNVLSFRFSEDIGKVYENIVFEHLMATGREIYYWKNKGECDFVIKEGNKIKEAIQVCYDVERDGEREVKGLLEVLKKFKLKEGLMITEDYEEERKVENKKIRFIPLWKFLLGPSPYS